MFRNLIEDTLTNFNKKTLKLKIKKSMLEIKDMFLSMPQFAIFESLGIFVSPPSKVDLAQISRDLWAKFS
jgi:hypothetical protein